MQNKYLILLACAALPLTALAADFNGNWVRDNAKSDKEIYPLYWLTRGVDPNAGGGGGGGEFVITVRQDATGLTVTDSLHPRRAYPLDGKPHTVTMDTGMAKSTVTAGVQGDTLVIGSVEPYGGMPGNATATVKEVWSLSPDGKTLTIARTRELPAAKQSSKEIYSRK